MIPAGRRRTGWQCAAAAPVLCDMPISVHNRSTERGIEGRHEYIGRPRTLGNPFVLGRDGTRGQVIEKYRRWLWAKVKANDAAVILKLRELALAARGMNVRLMCHCKPQACHGDVIKACVEWMEREGMVDGDSAG